MSNAAPKQLSCDCKSDYQDKKYGVNKRIHNPNKNGSKCTVCGKQKGHVTPPTK